MSNSLQNKLYNHAETPPETLWNAIARTLDEQALQKNTGDRLKNLEVIPPATAWQKIATALNEENQEQKIRSYFLNLEVPPPSTTWNQIVEQLEEQPFEEFAAKMYDYEVVPAAFNWEKIASSFNDEPTKIIPLSKNYNRLIRIAAAAVIVPFLAWVGYTILNKSASTNIAKNDTAFIVPAKTPVIKTNEQPIKIKSTNPVVAKNSGGVKSAVVSVNKTITTPENDPELNGEMATTDLHTNSNDIAVAASKNLHKKNSITSSSNYTTEARYLVYLSDQGNMINLSKKLADLKCIYTKDGEVSQQALAKLDESQCNDQLKYWQEKIANSSLQSSSNPLELIEILQ